ncbi:hypothetical protein EAH87_11115 [Sphingomonas koreensis]|nr:hypothetical protein EAH87_11115 [Sphingomonas koreensis]
MEMLMLGHDSVKLFYGNKLNIAVLTDFDRGQRRKLDDLYKSALLDQERIILATEIAGKDEADIEDFFAPQLFVDLVNATYRLTDDRVLTAEKLEAAESNTTRLVKKAEAYFRLLPAEIPEFSHYDPAAYLLQHPKLLAGSSKAVKETLDRFESAFQRIGAFVS